MGEPARTSYRHEDGLLVESVTEPEWSEHDRALLLALLLEQKETCPTCGHPVSVCRDPKTAGRWQVVKSICQAGRVMQAEAENAAETKQRGLLLGTRLNGGARG